MIKTNTHMQHQYNKSTLCTIQKVLKINTENIKTMTIGKWQRTTNNIG